LVGRNFRSSLLLTRSSLLLIWRDLSSCCRRNSMTKTKNILRKTLREPPSSCFRRSRTSNCKCLLIDWCSYLLFALMWSSIRSFFFSICFSQLMLYGFHWYLRVCTCLAALWGRACMMIVLWSLLTTKKVPPIQRFCTLVMLWRRSSAKKCQ